MACRVTEPSRLREVRKYYWRAGSQDGPTRVEIDNLGIVGQEESDQPSSPNKTLTALMQLLACRLGAQRAMVSIVDEDTQHFLAESTRTLNLADTREFEEGDHLWLGCGGTARSEALCANTIEVPLATDNKYACFSVTDLSKDPRFCHLPYVAASPNFRYYAGTPLLTKSKVPLGSVFVMDDRPRGPPTQFEIDFLGVTAINVMEYLEMRRLSEARERIELMSRGLAAFVDGKISILPETKVRDNKSRSKPKVIHETLSEHPKKVATASIGSSIAEGDLLHSSQELRGALLNYVNEEEKLGSNGDDCKSVPKQGGVEQDIPMQDQIFAKAANLLRESLGVNCTILLDVRVPPTINDTGLNIGNSNTPDGISSTQGQEGSSNPLFRTTKLNSQLRETQRLDVNQHAKSTDTSDSAYHNPLKDGTKHPTPARVLSFSTGDHSPTGGSGDTSDYNIQTPDYQSLKTLLKIHPKGKLWTFDGLGDDSTEEEESTVESSLNSDRFEEKDFITANFNATEFLMECFPGARQVLFAPLVDIDKGIQVAACFAISFHPMPVFTTVSEIAFLRAFLNSVSVSVALANIAEADRQKGDFISSISHELRSPLHGIIASVELLALTELDRRQTEFCDAISTCGHSLLETITSILEYTKINTLRKDSQQSNQKTKQGHILPEQSPPGHSATRYPIAESLALSSIEKDCEDAVTITAAAYMHHTSTPHQPLYRVFVPQEENGHLDGNATSHWPSISVILNIMCFDWSFASLPGSFQRIVMNLVGNSLKYTQTGYVKVDLNVRNATQDGDQEMSGSNFVAELNVTDSGKGIGAEFLRTKLYSSFSQESTLAPGTGLGLHLVKSLVQLLEGTIEIESELGKGTQVTVKLPMQKVNTGQRPDKPEETAPSINVQKMVSAVRSHHQSHQLFAFRGFTSHTGGLVRDSLKEYLLSWLYMTTTSDIECATFIVVDEDSLPGCLSTLSTRVQKPKVIVVCDQTRQKHIYETYNKPIMQVELLTMPFGPMKVSKLVLACLESVEPRSIAKKISHAQNVPDVIATQTTKPPSIPIGEGHLANGEHPTPVPGVRESIITLPIRTVDKSPKQRKLRVLCVDDNAVNLRILKAFMGKLNFDDVTCAEDGRIAFDAVRYDKQGFDLIFMDLSMPVCDGFQCTSMIRSLEKMQSQILPAGSPKPPPALIVAVTGLASQRDQDAAKAAGADHFCTKPLKLARLKELLVEWGVNV